MTDRVIDVRGLRKNYGDVEAVRGIDLHVERGEVFALLGPNGAGKTTTVEVLEGYRPRTAGEASVLGHDPQSRDLELRRRIGIVLQSTGVVPFLTVRETVEQYAGFYPAPRHIDEVIALVGLEHKSEERVKKLSGGQQRRLDVAVALAGDPELLFLDEPTTGFDPTARRAAWEMVKSLARIGKTVFLTTHYMDEAQYLADRVAVIARGEIVAEGPPSTLAGRDHMRATIAFRLDGTGPGPELGAEPTGDGSWQITADDPTEPLHRLTGWALERGLTLEALTVSRPTLEDVYLDITSERTAP